MGTKINSWVLTSSVTTSKSCESYGDVLCPLKRESSPLAMHDVPSTAASRSAREVLIAVR